MSDDFIRNWPSKVHFALAEALDWLVTHDQNPESDGIVSSWVTSLCAFEFFDEDAPKVAALISKGDPHLVEHGVVLANALLRRVDAWPVLEKPLVAMIDRGPVDLWVVEAIAQLLSRHHAPAAVYRALAKHHGERPRDLHGIMRNRYIDPWRALETHYEQNVIQTLEATDCETPILPILEKKHGTRGFLETQAKLIRALGYEPEEHRKLLAQRPSSYHRAP